MGAAWRPLHRRLSEDSSSIVAAGSTPVHLALTQDIEPQPFRTACDDTGMWLGEWITGDIDQVTCGPCIEQVHA